MIRVPSPRNPAQKKTRVVIKRQTVGDEVHILCRSDGAHREGSGDPRQARAAAAGRSRQAPGARPRRPAARRGKIQEAIGRLKERYPRVARYYAITYDAATAAVSWTEHAEEKAAARASTAPTCSRPIGRTSTDDEIWRLYILLTRVEAAFRAMKSPLMERPIFHHLEHRVQTHIFLCVLAYHLLVAIEKRCLDQGSTPRGPRCAEQLSTHQVVTVVLPATNGRVLKIRKASTPEPCIARSTGPADSPRGHEAGARPGATARIVTQRPPNPSKSQHSVPQTVEVARPLGRRFQGVGAGREVQIARHAGQRDAVVHGRVRARQVHERCPSR